MERKGCAPGQLGNMTTNSHPSPLTSETVPRSCSVSAPTSRKPSVSSWLYGRFRLLAGADVAEQPAHADHTAIGTARRSDAELGGERSTFTRLQAHLPLLDSLSLTQFGELCQERPNLLPRNEHLQRPSDQIIRADLQQMADGTIRLLDGAMDIRHEVGVRGQAKQFLKAPVGSSQVLILLLQLLVGRSQLLQSDGKGLSRLRYN
jgi:hypothetical protein